LIAISEAELNRLADTVHDRFLEPSKVVVREGEAVVALGPPQKRGRIIQLLDPPAGPTHSLRIRDVLSMEADLLGATRLDTLSDLTYDGVGRRLVLECALNSFVFEVARLRVELEVRGAEAGGADDWDRM